MARWQQLQGFKKKKTQKDSKMGYKPGVEVYIQTVISVLKVYSVRVQAQVKLYDYSSSYYVQVYGIRVELSTEAQARLGNEPWWLFHLGKVLVCNALSTFQP